MPDMHKKPALISIVTLFLLGTVVVSVLLLRANPLPALFQTDNAARTIASLHTNGQPGSPVSQPQTHASHLGSLAQSTAPHLLPMFAEQNDGSAVNVLWEQPYTAYISSQANIRSLPLADSQPVDSLAPGTSITVYGSADGASLGSGTTWYRITDAQSAPRYVYGALVSSRPLTLAQNATVPQGGKVTVGAGKEIVISIPKQWLYVFQDGKQVADTAITTGKPGLDTPVGTFSVFVKQSPTTFYSRWPVGSPNYFPPTHINYAMEFASGGYFIHDSSWRYEYGPGSDQQHYVPGYGYETGSHGCVNVPLSFMTWLYSWSPIGTTVQVLD